MKDENGDAVRLNETFGAETTAYTASTTADELTALAEPYEPGYTVTYNGSESGVIPLSDGENTVVIVVKNTAGYEKSYTLTVNKVASISVTFSVTPADATVNLQDSFGDRIWPVNGAYSLLAGADYSYTVTKNGYIGQKNSFQLTQSGVVEIALERAPANESIDETIYAQWGSFRGETTWALRRRELPMTRRRRSCCGLRGTAPAGPPRPVPPSWWTGILDVHRQHHQAVDRNTGEIVAEGTMAGSSSFSIVPATYAAGMIFVGLSNGRIQAFNAETLESLWLYTDPLGGQPNCPITYQDGYIYAGFWNSETRDANFVCLSVTDEDPTATEESKISTWSYTRAGGFYWAGAYATEQFVLVGTDDGQSGYSSESASLLVFDRLTGALLDSPGRHSGRYPVQCLL